MRIFPCRIYFLLFFLGLSCFSVCAQEGFGDSSHHIRVIDINKRVFSRNDTVWTYSGICKPLKKSSGVPLYIGNAGNTADPVKQKLISIKGTITYDFLYRSFADTPFYQKDFRQHSIQTSLSVTIKDKYPFSVNFVIRKSNSPYFRDFIDGGLLFDKFSYYQKAKEDFLKQVVQRIRLPRQDFLSAARQLLEDKIKEYNRLKSELASNGVTQRIIEERERNYYRSSGDSLLPANTGNLFSGIEKRREQLDSLYNSISKLEHSIDSVNQRVSAEIASARQKFSRAKSLLEIKKLKKEFGIRENERDKSGFIDNIRQVGIGRSVLNYSELTARNVSLTGANLEYNDGKKYLAFAAGKIDYGFRDFFGRNNRQGGQYLVMGRAGIGDIDRKALILSVFKGRKLNYGSVMSDTAKGMIPVIGYSIEAIIKKDENTSLAVEFAKSALPIAGTDTKEKSIQDLFNFSDGDNTGISVTGQTIIAETDTKLSGLFRKTGQHYQSFSLFSYNTDQTAWLLKADQPLFNEKVQVTATLRRNDFVNPFTEKTFKTTTVFTSLQISSRISGWPALSLGYYPGSQLYIIDRNRVRENVYYILNGSAVHQYKIAGQQMVSSVLYNQYTSKGTDSGFINYTGTNYMLSHVINGRKSQLQGSFIYTDQQELNFYTIEGNYDYSFGQHFRIGTGFKYNKIINGDTYWGGKAGLFFEVRPLGSLHLQYEKSFLPTIQQTLFPVEVGRLTWIKKI